MPKVTYLKLHTGVFIPEAGNLGDTLPPASKRLKDFEMQKQIDGNILLSWTDERTATIQSAEIGSSNVAVLVYESRKLVKSNA